MPWLARTIWSHSIGTTNCCMAAGPTNEGRAPLYRRRGRRWGWSHLPGSVPDCDDTPGALLAVRALAGDDGPQQIDQFVQSSVRKISFVQSRATS